MTKLSLSHHPACCCCTNDNRNLDWSFPNPASYLSFPITSDFYFAFRMERCRKNLIKSVSPSTAPFMRALIAVSIMICLGRLQSVEQIYNALTCSIVLWRIIFSKGFKLSEQGQRDLIWTIQYVYQLIWEPVHGPAYIPGSIDPCLLILLD